MQQKPTFAIDTYTLIQLYQVTNNTRKIYDLMNKGLYDSLQTLQDKMDSNEINIVLLPETMATIFQDARHLEGRFVDLVEYIKENRFKVFDLKKIIY